MAEAARAASERAGRRAGKNTVVRAAGEITGKLASLVLFGALAREVSQAEVGIYIFAFGYLQLVTLPVGLGLDRLLIRRIAQDHSRAAEVWVVLGFKLRLWLPVALLGFAGIVVLGYGVRTQTAIVLLAPGLLMDSLARSLFSVFTAFERSSLVSLSLVVQRVAAAALGIAALTAGFGVLAVTATYTAGTALGFALACWLGMRRVELPRPAFLPSDWRRLTRMSLPFAAQDVFGVLLARIDVVMLSLLATHAAVGRYGGAYRLLESTFFLTSSVVGAFTAMYTYLDRDSDPSIGAVFQRSLKLVLVLLMPCAVGLGVLAAPVTMLFLGGGFSDAAEPLRVLAPVVVLMGVVYLGTSLVVSRGNPTVMVWVIAGAASLNIALNAVLIPSFGDRGAAAAMLGTEIVLSAIVLVLAVRSVGRPRWMAMLGGPLVGGAGMAFVMLPFGDALFPAAALGLMTYAILLLATERLVAPEDLRFLRRLVAGRFKPRATG